MATRDLRGTMIATLVAGVALTMLPLPASINAFRPDWVLMLLIYWSMRMPQRYSVGTAWLAGITLDVVQGTYLGQHALAMSFVVFLTVKFHLLMRMFPLLQLTLSVAGLVALYQFLLFWINGVAGISAPERVYWAPVLISLLAWPFVSMFMNGLTMRAPSRG
ncbi:MAG: rod shape-determining protein MreD [Pseudomonadota bacterium]